MKGYAAPRASGRALALAFACALLALSLTASGTTSARAATPPNVVILLADDQRVADTWQWPTVENELYAKGVGFANAMVPTSACCPSRAAILTGNFSHTTGVWTNRPPLGGFPAFHDESTLATWLDDAGYQTGLFGKYMNEYGIGASSRYVPPGWDAWAAFVHPPGYYDYRLNVDGTLENARILSRGLLDRLPRGRGGGFRSHREPVTAGLRVLGAVCGPPTDHSRSGGPRCVRVPSAMATTLVQRARRLRQARLGEIRGLGLSIGTRQDR